MLLSRAGFGVTDVVSSTLALRAKEAPLAPSVLAEFPGRAGDFLTLSRPDSFTGGEGGAAALAAGG